MNNAVTGQTGATGSGEQKVVEDGQLDGEVEIIEGEKKKEQENLQQNESEENEIEVSIEAHCDYLVETDSFTLTVFVYPGNIELNLYMTRPDGTVKQLDSSDYGWSISVKAEGEYVFAAQDANENILASKKLEVKRPTVSEEEEEETEETKETEKLQESGQEPAENGSQTPVPDGTTGEDEEDDDDDDVEDEVVETLTLDKQNTKKEGSDASSEEKKERTPTRRMRIKKTMRS